MSRKDSPPSFAITSSTKNVVLVPLVQQWVQREIVTADPSRIPAKVHFSRLFYVDKKDGKHRPILDLSFLNSFIVTPSLRMETLDIVLGFVSQMMWASSLDVTDAFLSVKLHPLFQRYFCFILDGIVYMFLRLSQGSLEQSSAVSERGKFI